MLLETTEDEKIIIGSFAHLEGTSFGATRLSRAQIMEASVLSFGIAYGMVNSSSIALICGRVFPLASRVRAVVAD
jgi:hypothetical protein